MSEFTTVDRKPSLVALVTEQMLDFMGDGRLLPGQALPSERSLSEQFGVSRTVIREAVRSLEAQGVIEVLSGRGARVASVSADKLGETLQRYLHGAQAREHIGPADIAEVRSTLEIRLVELACERATSQELAEIDSTMKRMISANSVRSAAELDEAFHRLIASATHNELFVALLDPINATMFEIREKSLRLEGRKERAVAQHAMILEALKVRDVSAAVAAMTDHLIDSRQFYSGQTST